MKMPTHNADKVALLTAVYDLAPMKSAEEYDEVCRRLISLISEFIESKDDDEVRDNFTIVFVEIYSTLIRTYNGVSASDYLLTKLLRSTNKNLTVRDTVLLNNKSDDPTGHSLFQEVAERLLAFKEVLLVGDTNPSNSTLGLLLIELYRIANGHGINMDVEVTGFIHSLLYQSLFPEEELSGVMKDGMIPDHCHLMPGFYRLFMTTEDNEAVPMRRPHTRMMLSSSYPINESIENWSLH